VLEAFTSFPTVFAATTVNFVESPFAPIAVGFFGLGTGYLIYGPQELFRFPGRTSKVDLSVGLWGIWMPGLMQLIAGTWLFAGLALFTSFKTPALYAAAVAFTAYGVHWFAIGLIRTFGGDARPLAGMCVAFTIISVLGIVSFFKNHDAPVAGLFIGLTCIYVSDFFASAFAAPAVVRGEAPGGPGATAVRSPIAVLGERALGFFHLGTGGWLMYLTWAAVLNIANGMHLTI
jgi:hypothetical protein